MAEFSKTVSAPNVAAPVAPLQTNTGSASTDALAAVQFGLDLYRRSEAQGQQMALLEQKSNTMRATESVLSKREELISQGVSGTKLQFAVLNEIKTQSNKYGLPTTDLRMSVGKFQGKNTTELLSEAQTAEQKVVLEAEENRRNSETELASLIGYLPPTDFVNNPSDLSDKDLQNRLLQAKANKSTVDAQTAKLALTRANRNNIEEQRIIDVRNFSDQYSQQANTQIGHQIVTQLGSVDFNDPTQIRAGIQMAENMKNQLPEQIRIAANSQGLSLSRQEVQTITGEIGAQLDTFTSYLKRDDIASLNKNLMEEDISHAFFNLRRGTPAEQQAATTIMLGKAFGLPPELKSFNTLARVATEQSLAGRYTDGLKNLVTDPQFSVATQGEKQSVQDFVKNKTKGLFAPKVSDIPDSYKEQVTDSIIKNFSGSSKEVREFVKSGGFQAYLEGLASDSATSVLNEVDLAEAREVFAPVVQDVLGSITADISLFVRSRQGVTSPTLGAPERTGKAFDIDPTTLMITPSGVLSRQTPQSKKLNSLLQNTLKAYKNLGYSEQEIALFKEDVLRGFGLVVTQEESTNAEG